MNHVFGKIAASVRNRYPARRKRWATRVPILALSLSSLVTVGCSRMSPEFTQNAKLTYQMTQAAEQGYRETVLQRDFDAQVLKTKASISTSEDREAFQVLDNYKTSWQVAEDFAEDKRVIDICHEAARKIFDPTGTFVPKSDLREDALKSADGSTCRKEWTALIVLKETPEWKAKVKAAQERERLRDKCRNAEPFSAECSREFPDLRASLLQVCDDVPGMADLCRRQFPRFPDLPETSHAKAEADRRRALAREEIRRAERNRESDRCLAYWRAGQISRVPECRHWTPPCLGVACRE